MLFAGTAYPTLARGISSQAMQMAFEQPVTFNPGDEVNTGEGLAAFQIISGSTARQQQ
jgi:hypothetical protein